MSPAPDRERGDRRTDERCGAEETDLELAMAEREQVGGEENRHEPVGDRAERPRREHQTSAAAGHPA